MDGLVKLPADAVIQGIGLQVKYYFSPATQTYYEVLSDGGAWALKFNPALAEKHTHPASGVEGVPPSQEALPGTTEPAKPREPRTAEDIAHDLRMSKFLGKVVKETVTIGNGRELQLNVHVDPDYVKRVLQDLMGFSASERMTFRILPEQMRIGDQQPEEFGDKVPGFAVAMIERLEKKSCEGTTGWREIKTFEALDRLKTNLEEMEIEADTTALRAHAVDVANLAFFLWYNLAAAEAKK